MLKRLAVLCLLLFVPLAACTSSDQPLGPGVTKAQADLHNAEKIFNAALRSIQSAQQRGLLQGEANEKVKKAVAAAHAAIKSARGAVDAGKTDVSLVLTAVTAVLDVMAAYVQPQ